MTGPADPTDPRPDSARPDAPDPRGADPRTAQADRGISPVAGRFGGPRSRWITVAALAAGCAAFLFATWDRGEPKGDPPPDTPARQIVPFEPARRAEAPPLPADRARIPGPRP
ncbi:hypothetical protein [Brevundimonas abyssalis]|uniref:Uncharacterized protein n=1 Tax=Brevundimonas abyssalis TAR-001 TaxID=1391729 RepID=A0A8E0NE68_9CAUL|nr:hypothetical protein [Brevundimonas abyssalis]GAD60676.1 hypothetical protein MBEBAB_2926 [Brevundimonas abyssalis TAR-001]